MVDCRARGSVRRLTGCGAIQILLSDNWSKSEHRSSNMAGHIERSLGDDPAAQNARYGAEPGPRRVTGQPESVTSGTVRNGILVGVCKGLPHPTDSALRPPRKPGVGAWAGNFADKCIVAEVRIDAAREHHKP